MLIACTGKFRTRNGRVATVTSVDAPQRIHGETIKGEIESYGSTFWCADGSWVGTLGHDYDLVEKIE
ncbi:MAG: hypothetical protein EOQ39_18695 [Mesorhizobium sp.]|uniref:hypothetical protein n=1 Tax=Mesorhizobium sp. TaxID=1871066 RepID=UPI000FE8014A|nr:hypothetical protein [Mesorhizobium sp.]RWB08800.1 MAG: hypothetical protein EOQ37_04645 [Mesorhizobium sp.]RWB13549.1 MAG: hypothetical protein EOQ39_18695 [Mesorhizobium sp.]